MVQFTSETPRVEKEYMGIKLSVPMPIPAGHVLADKEAAWVNGQIAGAVANGYSTQVRNAMIALDKARDGAFKAGKYTGPTEPVLDAKGQPRHDKSGNPVVVPAKATPDDLVDVVDGKAIPWDHQAKFLERFTEFTMEPSNRGSGGGVKSDPISTLARSFAELDLIARINRKGLKVADFRKAKVTVGDVERSKFQVLLDEQFAKDKENYLDRAKAQMELANTAVTDEDDDLSLEAA